MQVVQTIGNLSLRSVASYAEPNQYKQNNGSSGDDITNTDNHESDNKEDNAGNGVEKVIVKVIIMVIVNIVPFIHGLFFQAANRRQKQTDFLSYYYNQ